MKKAIGIGLVLLMFLTYVIYKVEFKGSYYSNKSIAKEIEEDSKYFDKSTQDIIKKLNNKRYMDQLISKEFKRYDETY
jgi:hypothetical protein